MLFPAIFISNHKTKTKISPLQYSFPAIKQNAFSPAIFISSHRLGFYFWDSVSNSLFLFSDIFAYDIIAVLLFRSLLCTCIPNHFSSPWFFRCMTEFLIIISFNLYFFFSFLHNRVFISAKILVLKYKRLRDFSG